jgi:hypothetical protein
MQRHGDLHCFIQTKRRITPRPAATFRKSLRRRLNSPALRAEPGGPPQVIARFTKFHPRLMSHEHHSAPISAANPAAKVDFRLCPRPHGDKIRLPEGEIE